MVLESISGLDVLTKKAVDAKMAVVLFHGFGAGANDLFPLNKYLQIDDAIDWYFPSGIIDVPLSPSVVGKAWFPIDAAAIEEAMSRGGFRDFKSKRPEGIDLAIEAVHGFYNELRKEYKTLIIGGFSQGSMLAADLCFSTIEKPDALVLLSGALINEEYWRPLIPSCKGLPFFQSHGRGDSVLPFTGAEELFQMLKASGLEGVFLPFSGHHEIPLEVLVSLKSFLKGLNH